MNKSNDDIKECINLSHNMNKCREKNHNEYNCKEKCKEINELFTLLCRNETVVNIIKK
jgi:hypothetical protein